MQATITYLLSEQAQRAAMAATDRPVARKQTTTVEITAADMPLLDVDAEGAPYLHLADTLDKLTGQSLAAGRTISGDYGEYNLGMTTPEIPELGMDVLGYIRQIRAAREAEQAAAAAQLDAAIDAHIADPVWDDSARRGVPIYLAGVGAVGTEHPRYRELQAALLAVRAAEEDARIEAFLTDPAARGRDRSIMYSDSSKTMHSTSPYGCEYGVCTSARRGELCAEIQRRNESDVAAKKAAEAAKEQAKLDYIVAWVEHAVYDPDHDRFDSGDESCIDPCRRAMLLREQHAAGLLGRYELLYLIADASFRAAGVPEEHEVVMCDRSSCPCGSEDVEILPRDVYADWRGMVEHLPAGATATFERARDCEQDASAAPDYDGDGASEPYYTAVVTLPVGPFLFSRRVMIV